MLEKIVDFLTQQMREEGIEVNDIHVKRLTHDLEELIEAETAHSKEIVVIEDELSVCLKFIFDRSPELGTQIRETLEALVDVLLIKLPLGVIKTTLTNDRELFPSAVSMRAGDDVFALLVSRVDSGVKENVETYYINFTRGVIHE